MSDRRERLPHSASLALADLWYLPERWQRRPGSWIRLGIVSTATVALLALVSWRGVWSHPAQIERRAEELIRDLVRGSVEAEAELRDGSPTGGLERLAVLAPPRRPNEPGSREASQALAAIPVPVMRAEGVRPTRWSERSTVAPGREFRGRLGRRPSRAFRVDRVFIDLAASGLVPVLVESGGENPSVHQSGKEAEPAFRFEEIAELLDSTEIEIDIAEVEIAGFPGPVGGSDVRQGREDSEKGEGLERDGGAARAVDRVFLRRVRLSSSERGCLVAASLDPGPLGRSGEIELWVPKGPLRFGELLLALSDVQSGAELERFLPERLRRAWEHLRPEGRFHVSLRARRRGGVGEAESGVAMEVETTHFNSVLHPPALGDPEVEEFAGRILLSEDGLSLAPFHDDIEQAPPSGGARCSLFGVPGRIRGTIDGAQGAQRAPRGIVELELAPTPISALPLSRLPAPARAVLEDVRVDGRLEAAKLRFGSNGWTARLDILDARIGSGAELSLPHGTVELEEVGPGTGRGTVTVEGLSWSRWIGRVAGDHPSVQLAWNREELRVAGTDIVVDNTNLAGPPPDDAPAGSVRFRFTTDLATGEFEGEGSWRHLVLDSSPLTAGSIDGELVASSKPDGNATTPDGVVRGAVRAVALTLTRGGPAGEALSFGAGDATWWVEPAAGDIRVRARLEGEKQVLRLDGRVSVEGKLDVRCLLDRSEGAAERAASPAAPFELWNRVEASDGLEAWRLTGSLAAPQAEPLAPLEWPATEVSPER